MEKAPGEVTSARRYRLSFTVPERVFGALSTFCGTCPNHREPRRDGVCRTHSPPVTFMFIRTGDARRLFIRASTVQTVR